MCITVIIRADLIISRTYKLTDDYMNQALIFSSANRALNLKDLFNSSDAGSSDGGGDGGGLKGQHHDQ